MSDSGNIGKKGKTPICSVQHVTRSASLEELNSPRSSCSIDRRSATESHDDAVAPSSGNAAASDLWVLIPCLLAYMASSPPAHYPVSVAAEIA